MKPGPIRLDLLFDADEYRRSGHCPWTFFAYPTTLADENGLPPDREACDLLAHIQARGIAVSIWINGVEDGTTYFACRKEDIDKLHQVIRELEDSGKFSMAISNERMERLFAASERSPDANG